MRPTSSCLTKGRFAQFCVVVSSLFMYAASAITRTMWSIASRVADVSENEGNKSGDSAYSIWRRPFEHQERARARVPSHLHEPTRRVCNFREMFQVFTWKSREYAAALAQSLSPVLLCVRVTFCYKSLSLHALIMSSAVKRTEYGSLCCVCVVIRLFRTPL